MNESVNPIVKYFSEFKILKTVSKDFWLTNVVQFFDGMAYFSMITVFVLYLTDYCSFNDADAALWVGLYTLFISAFVFAVGSICDIIGIRRAYLIGFIILITGRLIMGLGPDICPTVDSGRLAVMTGILIMSFGTAFMSPVIQTSIRRFSPLNARSTGFNIYYLLMNISAVVANVFLIEFFRKHFGAVDSGFWIINFGTLMVLLGCIKRIGSVTEKLVPFMALFYVVLAVGVVVLNVQRLPYVLESIIAGAFNPRAFTGGAIGSVFLSVQKGVSRGIFSNEAGLGTGSIAHACADTRKPVKQGMFGIFEVFADTIVICTLTAMVILCSGVPVGYGAAAGAELTIAGFTATYGGWSSIFTAMALCCFAFSTIIGWGLYGSRCAEFLFRTDKVVGPFLVLYSFVSIVGATMDLGLLWNIADTFNGLMSIPNLIALLLLSGTVAKLVKEFFAGEGAR